MTETVYHVGTGRRTVHIFPTCERMDTSDTNRIKPVKSMQREIAEAWDMDYCRYCLAALFDMTVYELNMVET